MSGYLNTFNYKGKEYYVGSVVKLKWAGENIKVIKRHYVDSDGHHRYDFVKKGNNNVMSIKTDNLDKFLADVIEEADTALETKAEYYKDTDLDVMFYGWVIYITLMVLVSFVHGNVFGWILISIYFFVWRKKKLKKD
jgi:hypothetical protein